jgi:4-amino-4-deoxy-L-arabinose transferase-like glycosyltransferase
VISALLPATLSENERRQWRWWAAGLLLLCLAWLGAAPLFDVDEGAFSEATREMLYSGDWGHTTLNGEPRFDKPILVYWCQSASVALLGLNEFALRLPSALAMWVWCLATALFVWPRWGRTAALSAGSLLATSLGVVLIGRAATADALLNLWLALAAFDLWRHLEHGERAPLRRAAVWIGLGILTKGPVALLVPGAAVGLWLLTSRQLPRLRALLSDGRAWALLLLIALPWYLYALHRHGMAFVDGFFVKHNLSRYGGTLEGHGGSIGYYLVVMPLLLMPWTALLWPVLRQARAGWAEPATRYLLGWAGFVLVFFSLSGTKLPHYALYGLTPLAILAARQLPQAGRGMAWALGLSALAALGLSAVSIWQAPQLGARSGDPLYLALLSAPVQGSNAWAALITVMAELALATLVLLAAWCLPRALATRAVASAGLLTVTLVAVVLPWWAAQVQGPLKHLALKARAHDEAQPPGLAEPAYVQWRMHQPSLAVYQQRELPRRSPAVGELAWTRLDRLAPPQADLQWQVVEQQRGYALVRWIGPGPADALPEPKPAP